MSQSVPIRSTEFPGRTKRQRSVIGQQPTIFDVLSEESLMASLKPAIGHLIKHLAIIYPNRFGTANKWYDELYALFDLVLQNHYLKRYGASFSENFYNIKRIVSATGSIPSQGIARIRSLIILVIWPYIKGKLDKLHQILSIRLHFTPRREGEPFQVKLARYFLAIYPWIKAALNIWTFALQFGYILSWTNIHSPFLKFAGVHFEKLSSEDFASFERNKITSRGAGFQSRLWRLIVALPGLLSRFFGYGLLFVQFLDFYYNSDIGLQLRSSQTRFNNRIPPPPHKRLRESAVMLLETNKCPICLRQRHNDTVLSVSGYVFCYRCISDFIERERKCPVTSLPANREHLIRLFSVACK